MAKGENIFRRKDGRWEARYRKGYTPAGKIRYGYCYGKTYAEAKEKVNRCKAALAAGCPPPANGRNRFSWYCGQWLESKRGAVKESTYIKYISVVDKYIRPRLGSLYPLAITSAAVGKFSAGLADTLSPKTVKDILAVLRAIVQYTAKQFPGIFPAVDIPAPRQTRGQIRVLSPAEQAKLVNYLSQEMDCCKFGVLLALRTGMRIGELCALTWADISLTDNTVYIRSTMQRIRNLGETGGKTRVITGPPKSEAAVRVIPITEQTAALCSRMAATGYVLTGGEQYMEPRTLQYRLKRYTQDCGLEGVHFHTLRHTFATRCVEAGFELKSLSEILGHSTVSVTMNRYVHASLDLKRDNMRKLAAVGL